MSEGHGLESMSPFHKSMFDQTWPLQLGLGCYSSVSFMNKLEGATHEKSYFKNFELNLERLQNYF